MNRALACLVLAALLATPASGGGFSEVELRRILRHSPLPAPPPDPTNRVADDEEAARLGRRLFFDPRLSAGGRDLGKAIAAFERRIVSRDAPFDRFVAGLREDDPAKLKALGDSAQRGLKMFMGEARCWLCHSGPNFSDGEFHRLGVPERASFSDLGRLRGIRTLLRNPFNGLGRFSDDPSASLTRFLPRDTHDGINQFKTPTLRNAARTAPYMHNGRMGTLREVLRFYSEEAGADPPATGERVLRPLHLSDQDIDDLISFLQSLSGEPLPETVTAPAAGAGQPD